MNLAWPPSRCPYCRRPIRLRDNVPVVGWLALGGRCRDCQVPISPRYPIVEALCTLAFLALAAVDLIPWERLAATTVPLFELGEHLTAGVTWSRYALHCVLLTALLAAALIEVDGRAPPPVLWLLAAGTAVAWPFAEVLWRHAAEHGWSDLATLRAALLATSAESFHQAVSASGAVSLAALTWLWSWPRRWRKKRRWPLLEMAILPALVLPAWQAWAVVALAPWFALAAWMPAARCLPCRQRLTTLPALTLSYLATYLLCELPLGATVEATRIQLLEAPAQAHWWIAAVAGGVGSLVVVAERRVASRWRRHRAKRGD